MLRHGGTVLRLLHCGLDGPPLLNGGSRPSGSGSGTAHHHRPSSARNPTPAHSSHGRNRVRTRGYHMSQKFDLVARRDFRWSDAQANHIRPNCPTKILHCRLHFGNKQTLPREEKAWWVPYRGRQRGLLHQTRKVAHVTTSSEDGLS